MWLGGGAFVGALAWVSWWYVVVLARPAPPFAWSAIVFDAALFGVFALHHSLFARDRVKAAVARVVGARLERAVYVWVASALLVAVCVLWRRTGGDLYHSTGLSGSAHDLAQIAGLLLIALAVRVIDPLDLAGIRGGADAKLQIVGPYRLVRHPIYLGWMLAVFGASHMTVSRLAFAAISSLYLVVAVPWEERALTREFPREYPAYRRQVRWRIVPYIY
jgi:hypothetical protein